MNSITSSEAGLRRMQPPSTPLWLSSAGSIRSFGGEPDIPRYLGLLGSPTSEAYSIGKEDAVQSFRSRDPPLLMVLSTTLRSPAPHPAPSGASPPWPTRAPR